MPRGRQELSYTKVRLFAEKWEWRMEGENYWHVGYDAPKNCVQKRQVPFNVVALSSKGHVLKGRCITLKVDKKRMMREVKFVETGDIRWILDKLVVSIDGIYFYAH